MASKPDGKKVRTAMKLVRSYLINTAALGHVEAQLMLCHVTDKQRLEGIKVELTARVATTEGKLIEEIERDDD